jgi:hypothetical protein
MPLSAHARDAKDPKAYSPCPARPCGWPGSGPYTPPPARAESVGGRFFAGALGGRSLGGALGGRSLGGACRAACRLGAWRSVPGRRSPWRPVRTPQADAPHGVLSGRPKPTLPVASCPDAPSRRSPWRPVRTPQGEAPRDVRSGRPKTKLPGAPSRCSRRRPVRTTQPTLPKVPGPAAPKRSLRLPVAPSCRGRRSSLGRTGLPDRSPDLASSPDRDDEDPERTNLTHTRQRGRGL